MKWENLIGGEFTLQEKTYKIIRLLSQQKDTVVADITDKENNKFILKIDISKGDVFKSQIRKEQIIQDELHLYEYIVFAISESELFNDYKIVPSPIYQKIWEKRLEKEREEEEEKQKEISYIRFTLAVIMPNLGQPLSYELLYNQGKTFYPQDPAIFLKEVFEMCLNYLDNLHAHEIYYADLKPDNILFSPKDKKITIIDYGLSIKNDPECIRKKEVGGTPRFVSPYIQYGLTFLSTKFKLKNKSGHCYATKMDDYVGLYYTFLAISGLEFPWNMTKLNIIFKNFKSYDSSILSKYGDRSQETIKKIEKENGFQEEYEKFWRWLMDDTEFFSQINYPNYSYGSEEYISKNDPLNKRSLQIISHSLLFYLKLKYSIPNYIPDFLVDFLHSHNLLQYLSEEGITNYFHKKYDINLLLNIEFK